MVSRIAILVSPFLVYFFMLSVIRTKNPILAALNVCIMMFYSLLAAVIGVWFGLLILGIFGVKIGSIMLKEAGRSRKVYEVDDYGNKIRRIE
jgi:hypothetical protein